MHSWSINSCHKFSIGFHVWGFCWRLPSVDVVVHNPLLHMAGGVLGIVVLHVPVAPRDTGKTLLTNKVGLHPIYQEQESIHSAFKYAYPCLTTQADTGPNMHFRWVLGSALGLDKLRSNNFENNR